MAHDWILDVLADLKTYANKNGLSALADQLGDTSLLAAAEITSMEGKAPQAAVANAGTTRHVY